jgi:hypothetical protein
MEDITEFSLKDIHLFPELLAPFTLRRGMWGILNRKGRITIIVDLQRLLKEKVQKQVTGHPEVQHHQ